MYYNNTDYAVENTNNYCMHKFGTHSRISIHLHFLTVCKRSIDALATFLLNGVQSIVTKEKFFNKQISAVYLP